MLRHHAIDERHETRVHHRRHQKHRSPAVQPAQPSCKACAPAECPAAAPSSPCRSPRPRRSCGTRSGAIGSATCVTEAIRPISTLATIIHARFCAIAASTSATVTAHVHPQHQRAPFSDISQRHKKQQPRRISHLRRHRHKAHRPRVRAQALPDHQTAAAGCNTGTQRRPRTPPPERATPTVPLSAAFDCSTIALNSLSLHSHRQLFTRLAPFRTSHADHSIM